MRILTVCTSTKVFGAEVITLKLLEGLARAGHEQLAVTSSWTDGDFNRRLASIGVPEYRLPFGAFSKLFRLQPMWWTANTAVRLPWLWIGWMWTVSRFKPDVVLFTSSRLALPVYPWLQRQPSFLIEHSYIEATPTKRRMYRLLARKLAGFVAVSNFMGEHVARIGAPKSLIHVIRNGPFSKSDLAGAHKRGAQLFGSNQPARIGIVGQISEEKGHALLIEALKIVKGRDRCLDVLAFGSGNSRYIAMLSEKLNTYGLTSCWHWKGYESNAEKIYEQFDMCVMPSSNESFGMVAVEASAHELPIIASNRGGLREIVEEGVTGFLIDPDDPNELSEKICWLLDNPEAARRFGVEGRKRVFREFTQEQMVAGYESLFRRSLDRP